MKRRIVTTTEGNGKVRQTCWLKLLCRLGYNWSVCHDFYVEDVVISQK